MPAGRDRGSFSLESLETPLCSAELSLDPESKKAEPNPLNPKPEVSGLWPQAS